jgi:NADH-quinone oxidoreductase subunit L
VIEGMHHEQDMRKMGALWKLMPITYAVMMIGTLAITGVGIPGLDLGFAGFYSKDAIINAAYAVSHHGDGAAAFAFIISVIAAGLTSFYSWRLIFMTFHGHAKWGQPVHGAGAHAESHEPDADTHAHDDHGHDVKPHESPWVMLAPLVLLSIGAVFAGRAFVELFVGESRHDFWRGAILALPTNHALDPAALPALVVWAPLTVTAIGLVCAWYAYILREGMGARIAARRGLLWSFLYNKWYFDELYDAIFVRPAKALGDLFWKGGDKAVIDGLGPDGVSAVSYVIGKLTGRAQTGYVYHYAFVMLLGVAGLLVYALGAFH